jgi:HK97 gp10 family phage protein
MNPLRLLGSDSDGARGGLNFLGSRDGASDYEVPGLSNYLAALDALPVEMEKNIVRAALRAGMTHMAGYLARVIPVGQPRRGYRGALLRGGDLLRSMRLRSTNKAAYPKVVLSVGNKTAFYAHMVESGTIAHEIRPKNGRSLFIAGVMRKQVKHPGARPRHFVRDTFEQHSQGAVEAFKNHIDQKLPALLKKLERMEKRAERRAAGSLR